MRDDGDGLARRERLRRGIAGGEDDVQVQALFQGAGAEAPEQMGEHQVQVVVGVGPDVFQRVRQFRAAAEAQIGLFGDEEGAALDDRIPAVGDHFVEVEGVVVEILVPAGLQVRGVGIGAPRVAEIREMPGQHGGKRFGQFLEAAAVGLRFPEFPERGGRQQPRAEDEEIGL